MAVRCQEQFVSMCLAPKCKGSQTGSHERRTERGDRETDKMRVASVSSDLLRLRQNTPLGAAGVYTEGLRAAVGNFQESWAGEKL